MNTSRRILRNVVSYFGNRSPVDDELSDGVVTFKGENGLAISTPDENLSDTVPVNTSERNACDAMNDQLNECSEKANEQVVLRQQSDDRHVNANNNNDILVGIPHSGVKSSSEQNQQLLLEPPKLTSQKQYNDIIETPVNASTPVMKQNRCDVDVRPRNRNVIPHRLEFDAENDCLVSHSRLVQNSNPEMKYQRTVNTITTSKGEDVAFKDRQHPNTRPVDFCTLQRPVTPPAQTMYNQDRYYKAPEKDVPRVQIRDAMFAPSPPVSPRWRQYTQVPSVSKHQFEINNLKNTKENKDFESSQSKSTLHIKPPKFDGTGWAGFKVQFTNACRANGWDDVQKLEMLIGSLTGKAIHALYDEPDDEGIQQPLAWSFEDLMSELEERFDYDGTIEDIERDLQTMKQSHAETEMDFADRIITKARKLPMARAARSRLVMRVFTEGVRDAELRMYFVDNRPTSLRHAREILQRFRTRQRVGPQGRSNQKVSMVSGEEKEVLQENSRMQDILRQNEDLRTRLDKAELAVKNATDQLAQLNYRQDRPPIEQFRNQHFNNGYFRNNRGRGTFRGRYNAPRGAPFNNRGQYQQQTTAQTGRRTDGRNNITQLQNRGSQAAPPRQNVEAPPRRNNTTA